MRGIVNIMSGICGMIPEIRATSDDQTRKENHHDKGEGTLGGLRVMVFSGSRRGP